MKNTEALAARVQHKLGDAVVRCEAHFGEVTAVVEPAQLLAACQTLRDDDELGFEQLIDVAGVDYLEYGVSEWATEATSNTGYSRGVDKRNFARFSFAEAPSERTAAAEQRFAVAYQLLSIRYNRRLRLKVFCPDEDFPCLPSVINIWQSANWFEREAFDLYGIVFEGHPDLRRLLTDYGFVGHPFRKDFPLIGHVEMRYDPEQERVIYQPVTIEPRVLVPKVRREDHRYLQTGT